MLVIRFSRSQLGAVLAASLALALPPSAADAYTFEQQQACSGDAFRLCSSEIPDIGRVKACMVRNKSQLSPECRVYFRYGPESEASATGSSADVRSAAVRRYNRLHRVRRAARPDAT
jgi:hypothetical protein